MKRLFIIVLLLLPIEAHAALDIYGGDAANPCAGTMPLGGAIPGATGFFYVYKDTNLTHWMFCDPLGNRMWMTGAQVVDNVIPNKYGAFGSSTSWEATQTKRLQAMGFNTVGEFARKYMWAPLGAQTNPIPFILQIQPALYDVPNAKDIMANLPPKWPDYRGYDSIDLYDPLWTGLGTGAGGSLWNCSSAWGASCATFDASPYLVATGMDDVSRIGIIYINQGVYAIGITAPYEQFENGYRPGLRVFSNPIMYTKQQWGTWLCGTRYASLAALNTAWGSNYTSCGSTASTSGTETIGTGNGSATSFSTTLAHTPVDPASVGIRVGGVLQGGDTPWFNVDTCGGTVSGTGCIQAALGNINGGTVTYASGSITVTFAVAPANGVAITATYQYNGWPKAMMQTYTRNQTQSDTFIRGDGGLGANWTTTPNLPAPTISTNTVIPGATQGSGSGAYWSGAAWANDQYSTVTLGTLDAFGEAGAAVRISAAVNSQYFCQVTNEGASVYVQLSKFVGGVYTVLSSGYFSVNSGDTLTAQAIGTSISCVKNGGSVAILSATDSSLATGNAGLIEYVLAGGTTGSAHITAWSGGTASVVQSGGTGVMDEDGTSSWWPAGDPGSRTDFPDPPVGTIQTDMDVFLNLYVAQYTKPTHDWIKANFPNHLVSSVDQAGYGRRTQSYSAVAANADVMIYSNSITGTFSDFSTPTIAQYNLTPVPVYVGLYMTAQPDSPFSASACPYSSALCFNTQADKGAFYSSQASSLWNSVVGADTYHFIIGIDYWEYYDKNSEQGAYGLVSLKDNLYNGANCPASGWPKEDVNSSITDHFGFTTAAEAATYGNFICSGVTTGNAVWLGSQPIVVSITGQPPSSLQVNAVTGVTASVANDAGAAGVDWSLTCGGGSCGSITAHTASGVAATYTAPASVPSGAVIAKATSTTDNTKSASANGITITTAANIVCCNIKKGSLPFLGGNGTGPLFRVPHVGLPR